MDGFWDKNGCVLFVQVAEELCSILARAEAKKKQDKHC